MILLTCTAVVEDTHLPETYIEEPSRDVFCLVTFKIVRDPCFGNHISATAGS